MRHQCLHIKVLITGLLYQFILVPFLNGQSINKVDSLLNSLAILKEDTHKVNALVELSRQFLMLQNPQRSGEYLAEGLALGEHLQFKPGIMRGINMEGNILYVQRRYDEAISKYLSSLHIAKSIGNKIGMAKGSINLANAYNALGRGTDALKYYEEAYKLSIETNQPDVTVAAERNSANILLNQGDYKYALEKFNRLIALQHKAGNEQGFADAHHSAGICHFFQGNLNKALEHYLIALKIREEKKEPGRLGDSYNDIANVYHDEGQHEKALEYYQKALSQFEATGNQQRVSVTYNNLGNLYSGQMNFDKALENHEISTKIKEKLGDKQGLIASYNNLANIYILQQNPEKALQHLEAARQLCEELKDKAGLASTHINHSRAYTALKKYTEARIYITDAIHTFKEIGSKSHLHSGYNFLSRLDSIEGDIENSMANYKLAILYKDSLFNEERTKMIADLQLRYDTEKKDSEIQKLTDEKKINSLQLALQEENVRLLEAERGRLQAANLFNLQQVQLLDREKQLQALELEKKEASNLIQQSEIERNFSQLALMNKESEIQRMEIKKQRQLKNYFMGGILLFGFLSFFAYNYYVTKQKLKLQVLRNKIASDLHDDVGSTLSSISIFSEIAKEQSKESIPMLETIGDSSRKMLDAMADIVWTINPENDQLERILLKMRSFAYELLGAKKIAFKFTADDHISNIKLPMEVRKNLYLIFKEAANNMAKYSGADKAFFSLKEEKGYLTMMIRDNGKGFDPIEETTGNGIKNMRKRAEEISAFLRINSNPGEGTYIELKVAI